MKTEITELLGKQYPIIQGSMAWLESVKRLLQAGKNLVKIKKRLNKNTFSRLTIIYY